jgi:hypothetical protein
MVTQIFGRVLRLARLSNARQVMSLRRKPTFAAIVIAVVLPQHGTAEAATGLDGAALSWPWALPFIGILLSIAAGPLLFPRVWHRHYPTISGGWAALLLLTLALSCREQMTAANAQQKPRQMGNIVGATG